MSSKYFQNSWKITKNGVSFKRRRFPSTETIFSFTHSNDILLTAFQNSTLPACVKTEVGRRFVVNSACYKFLALLFTMISGT